MRYIVKILKNKCLSNKNLRNRTDLSPILKTYVHRYSNDSEETFKLWWSILNESEKLEIEIFYGESHLRKFEKHGI